MQSGFSNLTKLFRLHIDPKLFKRRLSLNVDSSQRKGKENKKSERQIELRKFEALFPTIVKDLTYLPQFQHIPEMKEWLSKVLVYNVPNGKKNRGLFTVLACKHFLPDLTPENVHLSHVLGWCVELLQSFFLVTDDIMDASETRRGQPCWYQVENLGSSAFNDGVLLESCSYSLMRKYFKTKDYYADILDIVNDAVFKTNAGQSMDLRMGKSREFETFTMERYSNIVKYKTCYYTYHLPVALAMAMGGINDPKIKDQVQNILLTMGHLYQVQDDFLDCFGDEKVTGKIGTDIQDGKCSWPFVMALQKANVEQRRKLLENYGRNDAVTTQIVKQLYVEMKIFELFRKFEDENYGKINTEIEQLPQDLPKILFFEMLEGIYGRNR